MAEQSNGSTNDHEARSPNDQNGSNGSSSKESNDKQQRKRMRVPTSCSVCRKRKIKCDKVKPKCGSCIKSSVAHLCFYEEPSWISSEELLKHAKGTTVKTPVDSGANIESPVSTSELPPAVQNKIESLKDKIKQLEASIAVTELSRSTPPVFNSVYQNGSQGSIQLPQLQQYNQPTPQRHPSQSQPSYQQQQVSRQQQQSYYGSQNLAAPQPVAPPSVQYYPPPSSSNIMVPQISESAKYESDLEDPVDFHSYFPFIIRKRRLECHGPMTLFSSMKRDRYLAILWTSIWKNLEKSKMERDKKLGARAEEGCNLDHSDPLTSEAADQGTSIFFKELKKQKVSQKVKNLTEITLNKSVDDLIMEVLPSKKIIMILCFRFFKFVYPFLPFLDENTFLFEVDSICALNFQLTKVDKLEIRNKYDYAVIGILLIILKLGFLSISNVELAEKEEFKDLRDYQSNPKIINAAKLCLDQYKHWRKPFSLRVIQLLLYFRFYYRFCSEDDDISDGSESQIMLGSLISTAYSLGLNRDPTKLAEMAKSEKRKTHAQLWRRIWYKLLELDASQSVSLGLPLHVPDDRSYDTALPFDSDLEDLAESFINRDFKFVEEKNTIFKEVSNAINNLKKRPSVLDLMHLIKKLENFTHYKVGSLKEILSDKSLMYTSVVKKVGYLFEVTTVTLNINQKLFDHFENKKNLKRAHYYMEECLKTSLRIINTAMNVAFNEDLYVGKGFAFYFRAHASGAIFRAYLSLCGIALRLNQAKKMTKDREPARTALYDKFSNIIFLNLENTLQLLTKMSAKHYNFARMVTALKLFCHECKNPSFDFDQAAIALVGDTSGEDNLVHNHLRQVTAEDIPTWNIFLELLDSELIHLMEFANSSLATVLQPAVSKDRNGNLIVPIEPSTNFGQMHTKTNKRQSQQQRPQGELSGTNPSGTGRGQFYDPIDGFTKRSSVSTESSSFHLSPSAINQNNIFNLNDEELNKLIATPQLEESKYELNNHYDTHALSSDEYASLFGIFEDGGGSFSKAVDANDLGSIY